MSLLRPLLLLSAALLGGARGEDLARPGSPLLAQTAPRFRTPDDLNADIARGAPAFGGFYLRDGALHVVVTSSDPAARQAAVRGLFAALGEDLRRQGFGPEAVVFVPGQFGAAQLLEARRVAAGTPGLQTLDVDEVQNRVVVGLLLPGMEGRAQMYLNGQALPPGIVVVAAPPAGRLPTGPAFTAPHRARLDVPARVARGDVAVLRLLFTNTADEELELEHGSCPTTLEIADAVTGEVVLPIPGALACTAILLHTRIPAGGTVPLSTREWNLRAPSGERVPPGRYVVRAAFEVGALDNTYIRPPEQEFEVTAGTPRGGAAEVRDILRDGAFGIAFRAFLGEERGVQVVNVTVPDPRAAAAVERLLRERSLPLTRVRLRIQPPLRVPGGPGPSGAELKVETLSGPHSTQHQFEVRADLAPWLARGAWRCQTVVDVVNPATGERVASWPDFELPPQPQSCRRAAGESPFTGYAGWNGRLTDGTQARAGVYEVRAGVRLTLRGGEVVWLRAQPAQITVKE